VSWVLPSRGRPQNLKRLIDAWHSTEAQTTVRLRLDDDDPTLEQGLSLPLPDTWVREVGPRVPLSEIYNSAFRKQPGRDWWGFIGDDCLPHERHWDITLIGIAVFKPVGMVVPAGGHNPHVTPHFVLNGDLPRRTGWLALPGLDRLYIDTVWRDIALADNNLHRVDSVTLEHLHFSNGKALYDKVYQKPHKKRDRKIYEQWRRNASSSSN